MESISNTLGQIFGYAMGVAGVIVLRHLERRFAKEIDEDADAEDADA